MPWLDTLSPAPPSRFRRLFVVLPLILAVGAYAFLNLGRFMSSEDMLQKADVIFVFAGTSVQRPLEAADLYREGYAPLVVISRGTSEEAVLGQRHGIDIPTEADIERRVVRTAGVPDSAVIEPERIHDNTAQEFQTLHQLVQRYHWRTVILVSSKYHLRRIRFAAWREFRGADVQLVLRGSRYDPATPDRWWRRRSDVRWMLEEVPKLAAYVVGLGA